MRIRVSQLKPSQWITLESSTTIQSLFPKRFIVILKVESTENLGAGYYRITGETQTGKRVVIYKQGYDFVTVRREA